MARKKVDIITFTKDELESLTSLEENYKHIKEELSSLDAAKNTMSGKFADVEHRLWAIEQGFKSLGSNFGELNNRYAQSTFKYFMQRNWWKAGAFLVVLATIFGSIGEVIYHLPVG